MDQTGLPKSRAVVRAAMQEASKNLVLVRAVCLTQLLIAAALVVLIGILWTPRHALAAAFGGLTAVVPTLYFAYRLFVLPRSATVADQVGAAFRGEIGKFALTAVLFWLGAVMFAGQFAALLGTYAATLLAYWRVMAKVGFEQTRSGN